MVLDALWLVIYRYLVSRDSAFPQHTYSLTVPYLERTGEIPDVSFSFLLKLLQIPSPNTIFTRSHSRLSILSSHKCSSILQYVMHNGLFQVVATLSLQHNFFSSWHKALIGYLFSWLAKNFTLVLKGMKRREEKVEAKITRDNGQRTKYFDFSNPVA